MMDRPMFRIGGYVLFAVVVFIVALLVTFPDGQIKDIAAVQIENQLEKSMQRNFDVQISDLDPWWLGFELEGLTIQERTADDVAEQLDKDSGEKGSSGTAEESGQKIDEDKPRPLKVTVPSIAARFAPLSSIFNGGLGAAYHVGLGGGSVGGTVIGGSTGPKSVSVNINDLNLNESPILVQYTRLPMFGTLSGGGQFSFAGKRPQVSKGNFELRGSKITIGPKQKLKIESLPFVEARVPQTNFGNLELKLTVDEGNRGRPTVQLDEFRSRGRDLQMQIWGDVELANRLANADAQLNARIRFNPDFVSKEKIIQALLKQEKFQNGKKGDWHGLIFWGRFRNLQWKGSPTVAEGPKKGQQGGGKNNGGKKKKKGNNGQPKNPEKGG